MASRPRDVYLLAAKRLGLPPERMMVLEDSGIGCRAALCGWHADRRRAQPP